MRVLIVEDDERIQSAIRDYLMEEGYEVSVAEGEEEGMRKAEKNQYDLFLIDIRLKQGDGRNLCRRLKQKYKLPVLFLTASGDEGSIEEGFDLGADDYIAKPFKPRELLSRMKNGLRRYGRINSGIQFGDMILDTDKGILMRGQEEIKLSALEYRLLMLLVNNKGLLLTRDRLLQEIWDVAGDYVNDNTLTVYMKRLRDKIEKDPASPQIIKTVRGLGYRVEA